MLRASLRAAFSRTARVMLTPSPRPAFRNAAVSRRWLTTTNEDKLRNRAATGPFTLKAAALFLGTGAGLLLFFRSEKERVMKEREEKQRETVKSYGKPKIGGPFNLVNAETGERFDSATELAGQFQMIYFGFTHCPDICPEELDKMAEVVDMTKKELGEKVLVPVFITCDPRRDTPEVVREYVKDFHPDMMGFTGNQDEIRQVAKSFRVYVSSPPAVAEGEDYLVDHSIFFYLMDPEGKFVDCYAKDTTAEEVAASFKKYYEQYIAEGGKIKK